MVTSIAYMAPQTRSRGALETVDDDWKRRVIAKIEREGISRADLAKRVGLKPSGITMLLKLEADVGASATQQTRSKFAIERELDLRDDKSDKLALLIRRWALLDEKTQDAVLTLVDARSQNDKR